MKKTPSKEVSLEIKGLFRDVVPWCSDEKFRRLVEYASTSIFTGSDSDEIIKAVASRIQGRIVDWSTKIV